jgi:hypothetical protein
VGIEPETVAGGAVKAVATIAASGDQAFFQWAADFVPLVITIVALMAIALLAFAKVGPATEMTRREKTLRVLVIVAAAILIMALVTRNGYWMAIVWPLMALCITLFILRWLAPQVPAAASAAGRMVSEKKREEHREDMAAQEETAGRGDALEHLLDDMVDERGDTELVDEAAGEDE